MPDGSAGISGRDFVNHISQANLFSIAMDASENWFRFHHLFQAMLQDLALTKLGLEATRDIHMRASQWLEEHDQVKDDIGEIDVTIVLAIPTHELGGAGVRATLRG